MLSGMVIFLNFGPPAKSLLRPPQQKTVTQQPDIVALRGPAGPEEQYSLFPERRPNFCLCNIEGNMQGCLFFAKYEEILP